MKHFNLIVFAALMIAVSASAEIRLPGIFSNGMVMQRNTKVNLWGWAKANANVQITASWTKEKVKAKADSQGKWKTTITTTEAGGPYTMTFSDGDKGKKTLTNILLGEVWVCGGQSNMEMPVCGFCYQPVEDSEKAALEAMRYPNIRMFTVPRKVAETPQEDCDTCWQLSTPYTVNTFSAMAYFFGKQIHLALGVPVGVVTSNWGGTVVEAWMNQDALNQVPDRNVEMESKRTGPNKSTVLYNGMITPIMGYTAKGFIWYQGESNRGDWMHYAQLHTAHIKLWREKWGNPNMPFYITQIAPYNYENPEHRCSALLIDAQYKTADGLNNCDVACTTDIGDPVCIHPAKKEIAATRLAYLALTNDYNIKGLPYRVPRFDHFDAKDGKLILHFKNIWPETKGCTTAETFDPRKDPVGFEVAGPDKKFYPAKAAHQWQKGTIVVWSDVVTNPVAVRYAYCNYPQFANVRTQFGQPLPSFRSDDWEVPDL